VSGADRVVGYPLLDDAVGFGHSKLCVIDGSLTSRNAALNAARDVDSKFTNWRGERRLYEQQAVLERVCISLNRRR
jgi:hypothetical protein